MGTSLNTYSPTIPETDSIVAPYGADINSDIAGVVRYTIFTNDSSQLNTVSSFIRSETNSFFSGTRMMIAEWHCVAEFGGTPVSLFLYHLDQYAPQFCSQTIYSLPFSVALYVPGTQILSAQACCIATVYNFVDCGCMCAH